MKRISLFGLVSGLIVFLCLGSYASETYLDLNQASDWQPAHDITPLRDTSGGILIQCTDFDPYIISKGLDFSAHTYSVLLIEMKADAGSQMQVFWARQDDTAFTEGKSSRLPLIPDGAFHTYTMILSPHSEWTGNIVRLRLDPADTRARVTLRSFQIIDRIGPIINPVFFYPDTPCAGIGKNIKLTARFRNEGDRDGSVSSRLIVLPENLQILQSPAETVSVTPGEEADAVWIVSANGECAETVSCVWEALEPSIHNSDGGKMQTIVQSARIDPPAEAGTLTDGDYRLTFCRTELGYGPMVFSVKEGEVFQSIALIPRLGSVHVQHNDGSLGMYPIFFWQSTPQWIVDNGKQKFTVDWRDRDNRKWVFALNIQKVETVPGAFHFSYSLESDGGKLLHFSGPELYTGEGTFGREKDMAVFPGIEYLDRNAVSSSDAVAHPPVRDQYIPHPYKNTIPYMSLTHDNVLISLLWPAHAEWANGERCLSPVFAVPNRLQGQNNHLFSLFVPNVPDYTLENSETAHEPYVMKAGEPVRIDSTIYLAKSRDPNDVLETWLEVYGENRFPDPEPAPRTYEEEIQLSRQAYLHSCWDEKAKGWGHCVGWDAHPSGGMLALLDLDAFLNPGGEDQQLVRDRVNLVYDHIVNNMGPATLGSAAGCHVMNFEPAFYWGVTETALPGWIRQAEGMHQSQNTDGSWGFHPNSKERAMLGKEGEVVSGTISPNAMFLMRLARISADPVATEAGLKALEALNQRTVPRGAQGWECPIAAGDILVSGQGLRANLDAYRITGNPKYLEKSIYWARSGIVFHYLWNINDIPLQRYACIPIFGTTFFQHSWLGVPVQWCGLVYSYALQELAEFDNSLPWLTLAEGIVNSAMHQQMTEGKYIGSLPDSYGDYFLTARGAWINPENIMTNLHALEGNSLNIQTVFPGRKGFNALRISANAGILDAAVASNIQFTVSSKKGRNTEILIAPAYKAPRIVTAGPNQIVPKSGTLFACTSAWRYLPSQKALLIHVHHSEESVPVRVEMQ